MVGVSLAVAIRAQVVPRYQVHISDVIYLKQRGSSFTLDVFKPKTPNRKAILFINSVFWRSYDGADPGFAKKFTDRGFTLFTVTHGSKPNYTIPEIIPMITRAVRFVRSRAVAYGIDSDAIGLCGADSGGQLSLEAAGLGVDDKGLRLTRDPVERLSGNVNAVVALFPVTDLLNWGAKGVLPMESSSAADFSGAFGLAARNHKEMMKEIAHDTSPIYLVRSGFPPTLLIHGDSNEVVPLQQAKELDSAFAAANVVHKLIILRGFGYSDATIDKGLPGALAWFDQYLIVTKRKVIRNHHLESHSHGS